MRKTIKLSFFLTIIVLIIITCKKDEEEITINVPSGQISASTDTSDYVFSIYSLDKTVNGDTTNLYISATTTDHNYKIEFNFWSVLNFKVQTYNVGIKLNGTSMQFIFAEFSTPDHKYGTDAGTINITKYTNDIIQGTFNFKCSSEDDSTKIINIKGQLNGSFTGFDPTIKDIDVLPGTMEARIDNRLTYFNAVAADLYLADSSHLVNITGTRGNESIVLQFIDLKPWTGRDYTSGIQYSDDLENWGYVTASYIKDAQSTYLTNDFDTTALKISIVKITKESIQGYFEFNARKLKDTTIVEVKSGKFNAKFKDYQ